MKYRRLSVSALVVVSGLALVACDPESDLTVDDALVTTDVAISAGEALASHLESMVGNETSGSFGGEPAGGAFGTSNAVSTNRTTACFDAAGAPVTNCLPISSVRRIVTNATLNGTRTRTDTVNGTVRGLTGAVHRVLTDTTTRVFSGATETARAHSGRATAQDTTTITEGDLTRAVTESAVDSIKAVTFSVPRSAYPVSGSIVRVDTVKITLTKGARTASRSVIRTVSIVFPPDAQGNVTMTVSGKTCTLNLATRRVSNCN